MELISTYECITGSVVSCSLNERMASRRAHAISSGDSIFVGYLNYIHTYCPRDTSTDSMHTPHPWLFAKLQIHDGERKLGELPGKAFLGGYRTGHEPKSRRVHTYARTYRVD